MTTDSAHPPWPIRLLDGRYRLGPSLGRGATSEVFRATDLQTGTDVAVKLFTTVKQTKSNVAGPVQGRETMAATPGVPRTRYVKAPRLLPEPLVFRLAARMAEALAHAHAHGVVHRDLKPSNVLVDLPSATLKLIDFGVAHVVDGTQTATGMTLGTPAYMAPEQLAGLPVSPASDAYALGVVLFEMLTARRPHGGANLGELLREVADAPAADLASLRPDLPRRPPNEAHFSMASAPRGRCDGASDAQSTPPFASGPPHRMSFEFFHAVDTGRARTNNEDSVAVDETNLLAVLADGMGGYNAGEVASGMATEFIKTELGRWLQETAGRANDNEVRRAMDICRWTIPTSRC